MSEEEQFKQLLMEAVTMKMPFGKYGPANYPPNGLAICDLPFEYLNWFTQKGFPKGHLGDVMKLVLGIKRDGAEEVFDALRGNLPKPSYRRQRKTSWSFSQDDTE